MTIQREPASFRDPSGGVFYADGCVYRYFRDESASSFRALSSSDFYASQVAAGALIESTPIEPAQAPALYDGLGDGDLVVEHPRLPLVSYPYEWPFEMLKASAAQQLALTSEALDHGYLVKDATPFNTQFIGTRPTFIDVASIEPYVEGAVWTAYAQFCSLFLNPLLLQSVRGIAFQPWLRASLEGIPVADLRRLLPLRSKLRKGIFLDVVLQDWFNSRFAASDKAVAAISKSSIAKTTVAGQLRRMAGQVSGLKRRKGTTAWSEYETTKSHYTAAADRFKEELVRAKVTAARPDVLIDLGCNRGQFSLIAAEAAKLVVAVDGDEVSVGALYERAAGSVTNLLPLVVDLLNPSPSQGWGGVERAGFFERARPDYLLCLALVHHLAISGNVSLAMIADWLADVAPAGIVEFVPKEDPMVQRLLATRKDVYPTYTQPEFEASLERRFRIEEWAPLPESPRCLYVLGPK